MPDSSPSLSLQQGAATDVTNPLAAQSVVPHVLDHVEHLVAELAASWHDRRKLVLPRRWHRAKYESSIALTPIDEHTFEPRGEAFLCEGRNISPGGVAFVHAQPLPHRLVAITFPARDGRALACLATRLNWCRFTRHGMYHSGGKFLRPLPGWEVEDWTNLRSA